MFESICLRSQVVTDTANPIDLGLLAESLLFYPRVLVIAKEHMIKQLARELSPDLLIEYLEAGHFELRYEYQMTGIHTRNSGSTHEQHSGIIFHSPNHALQHVAPKIFAEITGKLGRGRRLANRFIDLVRTVDRGSELLPSFNADLLDPAYMQGAAAKIFNSLVPEYPLPQPFVFEVFQDADEFSVNTNVDFVALNKLYHQRISPSHSTVTPAYILSHVLTTRENLHFASTLETDISTDPMNSELLTTKVNGILDHHIKNIGQINAFQDFVFDNGKAIRDAINSGSRSFKDLLNILEDVHKFHSWLKNKPPDTNLVKEYFREVTTTSWIDNLPSRTFRWAIFTGIGLGIDALGAGGIGTAGGITLSAGDAFILDRLIKGWKPNHFVQGPLERFINVD